MELFALALVLSLDNTRLATGLGLLEIDRRKWWRLAGLMALAEAGLPLLGVALGLHAVLGVGMLEVAAPVLLIAAATLSIVGMVLGRSPGLGRYLYALPLLFGIDNLLAGAAIGAAPGHVVASALVVGLVSGVVSLAVMAGVGLVARPLAARWAPAPAIVALAIGVSFLIIA